MQSDDDNETCNLHNKKTKKVDKNMQKKTPKTLNMKTKKEEEFFNNNLNCKNLKKV
jgi:hypothetical protein